jgi:hypothetical protein
VNQIIIKKNFLCKIIYVMTKDNKFVPVAPKTYEVKYVEQQDLYPDLVYEDIREQRGYGPVHPDVNALRAEYLESKKKKEEELERSDRYCIVCNSKAPMFREYCDEHYPPYVEQRERIRKQDGELLRFVGKTALGAGLSAFMGPPGPMLVGGAG